MHIDTHNHFAVPEYIDLLLNRRTFPYMERSGDDIIFHVSDMDTYTLPAGMFRLEDRVNDMDEAGVDMHVVSCIVPAGEVADDPVLNVELAAAANEGIAQIQKQNPERFVGMGTLPLLDPDASVKELDRAVNELGLRSMMLTSNVAGKQLHEPDLWPIYERAEELGVVLMIHPSWPVMAKHLEGWTMAVNMGFLFDSSVAMMRVILSGVMEKYPNLQWVLCHLGSTLPFLMGRLNRSGGPRAGHWGENDKGPWEYFKRVHIDTVSRLRPAIMFARELMGNDMIMFGTDYPYATIPPMKADVTELDLPEADRDAILGGNAARLFGIDTNG